MSLLFKYIKDPNRPIGSDVVTESEGEDGIKKITTTYSLNEKTGEVTVKNNTTTIEKKRKTSSIKSELKIKFKKLRLIIKQCMKKMIILKLEKEK